MSGNCLHTEPDVSLDMFAICGRRQEQCSVDRDVACWYDGLIKFAADHHG